MTDEPSHNVEPMSDEGSAPLSNPPAPINHAAADPAVEPPAIQPSASELEDVISDLAKSGTKGIADNQSRHTSSEIPLKDQPRDRLAPILDIPVILDIKFSSISMPVSQLMALHEGSQINLGRSVGEPVDLCMNGCVIARGVLFLMDGPDKRVGVRITASADQIDQVVPVT